MKTKIKIKTKNATENISLHARKIGLYVLCKKRSTAGIEKLYSDINDLVTHTKIHRK